MRNMKGKILFVFGIIVIIGLIIIARREQNSEKDKIVEIGVLSFLSGAYAEMGTDLMRGVQIGVNQYNNMENNKLKIKLLIEDGKAEAKTAIACFNKLLLNHPTAIIVGGDYQVSAIAPIADKNNIPVIVTNVGNKEFLKSNSNRWMVRDWIPISSIAKTVAFYSIKNYAFKTAAVITVQSDYGKDAQEAFCSEFIKNGGQIVMVQNFSTTPDVRNQVVALLSKNPEVIFVSGHGPGYVSTINQIREQGFKGIILTDTGAKNPENIKKLVSREKIIFADTYFGNSLTNKSNDFVNEYQKTFNSSPSLYSAFGYDSISILIDAMLKSNMSNTEIKNNLYKIQAFPSLNGLLTIKDDGDCDLNCSVKTFDDSGNIIVLEE